MKGYFHSIARQTGLQIPGRGPATQKAGELRSGVSSESSSPIAPIDKEETVVVPPSVESRGDAQKSIRKQETSLVKIKPRTQNSEETSEARAKEARPIANQAVIQPAPEAARDESDSVSTAEEEQGEAKKAKQESTERVSASDIQAAPPQTIETIKKKAFKGHLNSTEKKQNGQRESQEGSAHEPEGPTKGSEQDYFTHTAEIIGGQEAEPEEVQTILLHEIQEWVAGIEVPAESASEEIETHSVLQQEEPVPGVIRIGQKRSSESVVEEPRIQPPGIEEQNFDLSIGTINVVIEGEDKAPVPAPAPPSPLGQSKEDTGNRFSRLKRSFL